MIIRKKTHRTVVDALEKKIAALELEVADLLDENADMHGLVNDERRAAFKARDRAETSQVTLARFLDDLAAGRVGKAEVHGHRLIEKVAS